MREVISLISSRSTESARVSTKVPKISTIKGFYAVRQEISTAFISYKFCGFLGFF